MPIIISNASPLIVLSGIDRKKLWQEIVIPEAVYKEVVKEGAGKTGAEVVSQACKEWIKVVSVTNVEEVAALRTILDEGESEVIALGQQLKAKLLLLDNREPRLFASGVNLKVIGTLGIIKLAWKKGLIDNPVNELKKIKSNGFWVSDNLMTGIINEIKAIDN